MTHFRLGVFVQCPVLWLGVPWLVCSFINDDAPLLGLAVRCVLGALWALCGSSWGFGRLVWTPVLSLILGRFGASVYFLGIFWVKVTIIRASTRRCVCSSGAGVPCGASLTFPIMSWSVSAWSHRVSDHFPIQYKAFFTVSPSFRSPIAAIAH